MKVHKIVLLVVDTDDLGARDVGEVLETVRYPNHCIAPQVVHTETREVEWDDSHPLNQTSSWRAEFARLFG